MMKRTVFSVLVIVSLLAFLIPGTAQAGSGLVVSDSSVSVNFPGSISFNISAGSDVNITDIRLHYQVERMEHAQIIAEVYVTFTPAKSVKTQWVWDMRRTGGLPPGSSVTYWWTVKDAGSDKIETTPDVIHIEDGRYNWQTRQQGQVKLFWYQGNNTFADELMAAAQQALTRLADSSGAELESPVSLYIYASTADLQGSMIFPQEWTGGVAFSQYGVIAIGIAPDSASLAWGKRTISHELTHLVVGQVTFNPYNSLPTWLSEGLAMTAEGDLEQYFIDYLSAAEANNALISVRSLSSPFSAYTDKSLLAYAESNEIVFFLINEYGREKMFELLHAFRQGSGYDEALNRVYGFDMDGLNALWQAEPQVTALP
jgi:hypothetical protein